MIKHICNNEVSSTSTMQSTSPLTSSTALGVDTLPLPTSSSLLQSMFSGVKDLRIWTRVDRDAKSYRLPTRSGPAWKDVLIRATKDTTSGDMLCVENVAGLKESEVTRQLDKRRDIETIFLYRSHCGSTDDTEALTFSLTDRNGPEMCSSFPDPLGVKRLATAHHVHPLPHADVHQM